MRGITAIARILLRRLSTWMGCLVLVAAMALGAPSASAGPTLLFDARSGEVLHAHQPFAQWYPASLTKLMTAYVAFHAIRQGRIDLDTPVTISRRAAGQPPTKMGFSVGTTLSLDYALRIIIVRSANDVSVAIAEAVSGSLEEFVQTMNRAAARLGMTDTNFANPHGLPDSQQVTTARDMALLTRALIREFSDHQFYFQARAIRVGARDLRNYNGLLGKLRGADGMKTGYTCSSGFNLAASATRNGRRLVAIVFGAPSSGEREEIAAALLEEGFSQSSPFRFFQRSGPDLLDLPRPRQVPGPADLRPYVCHGQSMPEEFASFGLEAFGVAAGYAAEVPSQDADPLSREIAESTETASDGPAVAFSVPLPRPRPLGANGEGAVIDVDTRARGEGRLPFTLPEPQRTPLR